MSVASHITHLLQAEYLSHRALPNAPDGTYEPVQEDPGIFMTVRDRIHHQLERGIPLPQEPHAVRAFIQAVEGTVSHRGVDDRLHAFEYGLDMLSDHDPKSPF